MQFRPPDALPLSANGSRNKKIPIEKTDAKNSRYGGGGSQVRRIGKKLNFLSTLCNLICLFSKTKTKIIENILKKITVLKILKALKIQEFRP